jgi:hypothetical protein
MSIFLQATDYDVNTYATVGDFNICAFFVNKYSNV